MTHIASEGLKAWHAVVADPSESALDAILADEVVFHSPVVHTPQRGRALAKLYLMGAFQVLAAGPAARSFQYLREIVGERDAMLEFRTERDGVVINGVDLITWNDAGRIVDFKVLLRPLKAIELVHREMGRLLEASRPSPTA